MTALAKDRNAEAVQRYIEDMARQKPALESLFKAFGGVHAAIAECRATLPAPDISPVTVDRKLLLKGVPLLEQAGLRIEYHLDKVSTALLPAMATAFPPLAPALEVLANGLVSETLRQQCGEILETGNERGLSALADQLDMLPAVLGYVLETLARPALENVSEALAPQLREVPWNFWNKGNCPVCGSMPSMSVLQPGEQEPTEFLKNSSAQRWLCCSSCAHTWRFSRTHCPSCGHDEQENREYLFVEEQNLERVEFCKQCKHYLLTWDIRDKVSPIDHRLAPLGLIHLDIIARRQGYVPQVEMPWNTIVMEAVSQARAT